MVPKWICRSTDATCGSEHMTEHVVTVIVPVRNGARTIGALLDALALQQGVRFETIVVINATVDGTEKIVREHPLECLVVMTDKPGAYGARNAGAKLAIAHTLAFTDADCVPEPRWLAKGLSALADADLVGGAVHQVTSTSPNLWELYDATFYLRQQENIANGFAATANAFVGRDTFEALGGFDESFTSGGDHDFGMRLRESGGQLVYAPDAVVRHQPRSTAGAVLSTSRRIGAGWRDLSQVGLRPGLLSDEGLRPRFAAARRQVTDASPLARRSRLYPAHGLVTLARLIGRVTGR